MSSLRRQIKNVPFYPVLPFAPLLIAGSMLAIQAFILARLRKLAREVNALSAREAASG